MHLFFESPDVNLGVWSSKFPGRIFCRHSSGVVRALTIQRRNQTGTAPAAPQTRTAERWAELAPAHSTRLGSKWQGCLKQRQQKSKGDKAGLSENLYQPGSASENAPKCLCVSRLPVDAALPASYTPTRVGAIQPRAQAHETFIAASSPSSPSDSTWASHASQAKNPAFAFRGH